jgi:DNA ligase D-like protein (predicted ligase)
MSVTGKEEAGHRITPLGGRMPARIAPMLASPEERPFDSPDHIFELMWGGLRALARVADGAVRLIGRNGLDLAPAFPELARIPTLLHAHEALLDGEIVALDADGQPAFDLLRPRLHGLYPALDPDAPPASLKKRPPGQVVYQAFDVLWLDGRTLVDRPLWQRKNRLHEILTPSAEFAAVDFVNDEGVAFFDAVTQRKLEGIIAKEKASTYVAGALSTSWREVRALQSGDFAIGGYSFGASRRRREPFGQLLLGAYEQGRFEYVGAVSGGLTDAEARELLTRLEPLVCDESPFSDPPRIPRLIYWTRPELVCHVRFSEWSRDGYLRFPIFNSLRPDLDAEHCALD